MSTEVTEFGIRTTRLILGKCDLNHDKLIEVPMIDIVTKVDPVGFWLSQSYEEIKTNCDLMKIYMVWSMMEPKSGDNEPQCEPGFLQAVKMSIRDLNFIELLEDLAELFKRVADNRRFIEGILKIGTEMESLMDEPDDEPKMMSIAEAVYWVNITEDQVMLKKIMNSPKDLRNKALFTFFYQYSYLLTKMGEECYTLTDKVRKRECEKCDEECDRKKLYGNKAFQKQQYTCAIQFYTEAMQYSPHNHILFGNRSLCFFRMRNYWHALSDGKKAVVLKNTWPKNGLAHRSLLLRSHFRPS